VQIVGFIRIRRAPDGAEQSTRGNHAAGLRQQDLEQLELARRQLNRVLPDSNLVAGDVENDGAEMKAAVRVGLGSGGPAEDGAGASDDGSYAVHVAAMKASQSSRQRIATIRATRAMPNRMAKSVPPWFGTIA